MRLKLFSISLMIALCLGLSGLVFIYSIIRDQRQIKHTTNVEDKKITIIEGWTLQQIADYLEKQNIVETADFIYAQQFFNLQSFPLVKRGGTPATLEGFLFPDTYFISSHTTADKIIEKLLGNFSNKIHTLKPDTTSVTNKIAITNYENIKVSLFDIVTMASIIERETGKNITPGDSEDQAKLDQERALVAGIFYNRLQSGQPLESDATINYATGKNNPAVSAADLLINSPYNTYKYSGLPPGPIANPSFSSLKAAFSPIKTNYFYFFHKQPSGEVVYSKTFEEHRQKKWQMLH